MGTNYYWNENKASKCETCGHMTQNVIKHIGKSSAGWVFALHIYPEDGIYDLDDWVLLFAKDEGIITDEYGNEISNEEMLCVIMLRYKDKKSSHLDVDRTAFRDSKNNLLRLKIDEAHGPVKHGIGSWDCYNLDFS